MTFKFRPALALAVAVAVAILIALGVWQLQRREWKLDLIHQTERLSEAPPIPFDDALARVAAGENMEYAPVYLNGVYAHDLEARIFGTLDSVAGVYVFTPLDTPDPKFGGRRFVYVNRGFAPQAFNDPATREEGAPHGELTVRGLL
ncbi:MAG: SURF1 family protein, partial [Amphiplicatus sp.]